MAYRELPPPPELASHVACVWVRTGPPGRVLPDGCTDVVWTGAELIVAGPATGPVEPALPPDEPKLGVRFKVGAAGDALGLPAAEVLNDAPALAEVWPGGRDLTEQLGDAPDARARLERLVATVADRLRNRPAPDPLVRRAAVELARPRIAIADLGSRLGISERQLRRRFESAVGYSPRTLARVLRLQRFLALAARGDDLARLAAESGYADQPHLTRDCVELTGLPAGALLATGAAAAGERLRDRDQRPAPRSLPRV